jgi:PAS domain S-box-containing protein
MRAQGFPYTRRMQTWTARRLSHLGFVLAASLLAVVGWLSYRQMYALGEATGLVSQTLVLRQETEIVLSLLKDAETGQRGFIVTGDADYLDPYDNALRLLPVHTQKLKDLIREHPGQQANVAQLEPLIAARLAKLEDGIEARRRDGFAAAAVIISSDQGKRLMDAIRDICATMLEAEARSYDARSARLSSDARLATAINLGGLALAGLLVLGATALLTRANRRGDEERAARRLSDAIAAASLEAEERLRITVQSIGDAIIATDDQGRVTLMNPVAQALTGWTEAGARGHALEDIFQIVNESTRQSLESPVTKVLREGGVVGLANHTILIARDGREIAIDDSAAPIRGPEGRVQGVVMVFRDVTERRELDRRRAALLEREREARREAEMVSRGKDEFVATLSHELRTPLNAIFGWVRMLQAGTLEPEASRRALEVIERNTRTQLQLIEDLLDMSRIVTGKLNVEMRALDLGDVVEAAVDTVRPAAEARGLTLEVHRGAEPAIVSGDADRLQQVVWNLLSNAIRFTPKAGRIDVWLDRHESDEEMRVVDTGRGIVPDFLPYVFDRFRQADTSTARTHSGLGIGLALVRHLVELHGGNVHAASEGEGRGATFTVRLPRRATLGGPAEAPSQRGGPAVPAAPAERLSGLHVLVVDDDADARDLVHAALAQAGARVTTAASAAAALSTLDAMDVDVLVSDIGMPGGDGYELIAAVRARDHGARLPAVALTAYARRADRERALRAGFNLHVSKPIDPGTLVLVVGMVSGRTER